MKTTDEKELSILLFSLFLYMKTGSLQVGWNAELLEDREAVEGLRTILKNPDLIPKIIKALDEAEMLKEPETYRIQ